MKRIGLGIVVAVIVGAVGMASFSASPTQTQTAPAAGKGLEGTRWTVTVTPDAAAAAKGEKAFEDEIVIEKGKVTMTACVAYGFGASAYKHAKSGAGWSFETTQASEKEGETSWKGEMQGDAVKGTMTWKKKDGAVFQYGFAGKRSGS